MEEQSLKHEKDVLRCGNRRYGILVACALAGFVVVWVVGGFRRQDRLAREFQGFSELQRLAMEMIMERAPGVSGEGAGTFIASYDAFYAYVAKERPDVVGGLDSPNPFSGLLPDTNYGRLRAQAAGPKDELLWGRIHRRGGDVFRLTCGAHLE